MRRKPMERKNEHGDAPASAEKCEKIDVAVNVFAKPYATSLSILSLLRQSGQHVGRLWLQFEPMGVQYDALPAYCIAKYVEEKHLAACVISQPKGWGTRNSFTKTELADPEIRQMVRYQHAFEHSDARLLFLMHNDVLVFRDILGAMGEALGEAFAIGQLGQCWNCPASHADLTRSVLGREPCLPGKYENFQLDPQELQTLYKAAQDRDIFVRPYALQSGGFDVQPWPLPECRINEWACLLDLEKTRKFCIPFGPDYPPGAYRSCGEYNLDIGVAWFRAMHARGFAAKNFDLKQYMKHFVGTGNNTPRKYALQEDNALKLLRKHFPDYVKWLRETYGASAAPDR